MPMIYCLSNTWFYSEKKEEEKTKINDVFGRQFRTTSQLLRSREEENE